MRRLGGKHVMKGKVADIEQTKNRLPPQVHGHQLATHPISKMFDHTQAVQLTCQSKHSQSCEYLCCPHHQVSLFLCFRHCCESLGNKSHSLHTDHSCVLVIAWSGCRLQCYHTTWKLLHINIPQHHCASDFTVTITIPEIPVFKALTCVMMPECMRPRRY